MQSRLIIQGTAVAGTLDILSAFLFAGLAGAGPIWVFQFIASGPLGDDIKGTGLLAAALGLMIHFGMTALMVAVFAMAAARFQLLVRKPVMSGLVYGFIVYLVMYWIVLPYRWPAIFPQTGAWQVGNALFSHLICVGIPIALTTAHGLGRARRSNLEALPAATV